MKDFKLMKNQLTRYRDVLADFSRRNKELYYKESKGSTVNVGKAFFSASDFYAEEEPNFRPFLISDPRFTDFLKGKAIDLHDHFEWKKVKDPKQAQRLQNRLDKIRLSDDKHQREFGISGAWLLGPFLCFRESPQSLREEMLISPIFKIPVDLERTKKKTLALKTEKDDLTLNGSLCLFLKKCVGVEFSEDKSFDSMSEGVNHLVSALSKLGKTLSFAPSSMNNVPKIPSRFKIERDENGDETGRKPIILNEVLSSEDLSIYDQVTHSNFVLIDALYLDQMNASRTVLISDYDGILSSPLDHPILNELFNGRSSVETESADRSKLRILDSYREKDNHFVVDIDSTQHRAIDKATKSKAIVIQGPPGTGKSQTIVNLIADYLAKGKKVLFVSEKRPALDVVFNRMKSANIESQAVLIHSSSLNKSDLYKSFLELANSEPNSLDERNWESTSKTLDRIKDEINNYADAMREEHKETSLSNADVLGLCSKFELEKFNPKIFQAFRYINHEIIMSLGRELDDLQKVLLTRPDHAKSIWAGRHRQVVRSAMLEHELGDLANKLRELNERKSQLENEFVSVIGVELSQNIMTNIGKLPLMKAVDSEYAPLWKGSNPDIISHASRSVAELRDVSKVLLDKISFYKSIKPDTQYSIVEELESYYGKKRGSFDWLTKKYWQVRSIRTEVCPDWSGANKEFVGHRIYRESFDKFLKLLISIRLEIRSDIENHQQNIDLSQSTDDLLCNLIKFAEQVKLTMPRHIFDELNSTLLGFNKVIANLGRAEVLWKEVLETVTKASAHWASLSKFLLKVPPMQSINTGHEFVERLVSEVDDLDIIENRDERISGMAKHYEIDNLGQYILESFSLGTTPWSQVLESSVLKGWADDILTKYSTLRTFERSSYELKAANFREFVENHKVCSRQAVYQAFAKRWISSSDRSGIPLLAKEASKQRKVLSPREIMDKGALNTMMQLKPCWLMSPLSISQILPLKPGFFDVIIFDEASQVRVEYAIPSIYRASTMNVVGDNKQMPPTNFFSGVASDDDDEDGDEPLSESVLDLASKVFPGVLLEWHYRSRTESLIAFSNRAYYGGRLIAAPNPAVLTASEAIQFHEVRKAYFAGKSGNAVEAEAVINHLISLIKQNEACSYGVIAMGQPQTFALEEALEARCQSEPKLRQLIEKAMGHKEGDSDAGLFIKNLENVQGDERDVIIISIGYSSPSEGKPLRMNFGPLSKQGGGRRLNVAITRARSEMHVFCSFSPSQINTDEEVLARNPDLCVFGRFLKYTHAVASGDLENALGVLNSFGVSGVISGRKMSRFALDVKRRLEELGYDVSAEIGSSGFFVDLGIHHPVIKSNFVLGIECDGAIFHSTPYARDRDKIREELLKSRGWKIERIWSQDWSKDWRKEVARLDDAIKRILKSS